MNVLAENNFRANLKTAMAIRGLTQREVADLAKAGYPQLNRILNGHSVPTLEAADRLADAVKFSLSLLLLPPQDFSNWISEKITA